MSAAAGPENRNETVIFLMAGEVSGDQLGGPLMVALRRRIGGAVRFAGIGGERMTAEGLSSLFPMTELSLFGLTELLPHLRHLMRRIRQTEAEIRRLRPDAVIGIDAPGFCFRVARRLRGSGIPVIHYVAPSVWAWRPGRARKVAHFLDHLLLLYPFEAPYFDAVGLSNCFVGHPISELNPSPDGAAFRAAAAIPAEAPVLCVLPGSRHSETSRLLPVFGNTLSLLARRYPGLHVVVPTVAAVADEVRAAASSWSLPVHICSSEERWGAFAASDVALAASGTVSLELARAGVPMVIAYRLNPLTALIALALVRRKPVCLVNIILGRRVVPELLLHRCRPSLLAREVGNLFDHADARETQRSGLREAMERLMLDGESSSERAAQSVLEFIGFKS